MRVFDGVADLGDIVDTSVIAAPGSFLLLRGMCTGDVVVAGGVVRITGMVCRNVVVLAGIVVVTGRIVGRIVAVGGRAWLLESAVVDELDLTI